MNVELESVPQHPELQALQDQIAQVEVQLHTIETQIAQHALAQESLSSWAQKNQRSYLWKLENKLTAELGRAEADVKVQQKIIDDFKIPDVGRLDRIRRQFLRAIFTGTSVAVFAVAILLLAPRFFSGLREVFPGWPDPVAATLIGLIALVFVWLGALLAYHRNWSAFQRAVLIELGRMQRAGDNAAHAQSETVRLRSLHRQTREWLELISMAVHRPWAVKPQWLEGSLSPANAEQLPFAMRIASAQEGDPAAARALERIAAERLVRPGWRRDAFEALVSQVCLSQGLPEDRLTVDALDADLPFATNGMRAIMKQGLSDDSVLTRVAEPRVIDLAHEIQTRGLSANPPPVRLNREFPLEQLHYDRSGISELNADQPWDEFLAALVGSPRDPVSPLSPLGLSAAARVKGEHEAVSVYLEIPKRLEPLAMRMSGPFHVRSHDVQTVNPIDLVVRAEVVGPLMKSDVTIWKDDQQLVPSGTASQRICPTCHRHQCIEFAQGLSCTFTDAGV